MSEALHRQFDALPYLTAAVLGFLVGGLIAATTLAAAGSELLTPADAALLAIGTLVVGVVIAGHHGVFAQFVPDR